MLSRNEMHSATLNCFKHRSSPACPKECELSPYQLSTDLFATKDSPFFGNDSLLWAKS